MTNPLIVLFLSLTNYAGETACSKGRAGRFDYEKKERRCNVNKTITHNREPPARVFDMELLSKVITDAILVLPASRNHSHVCLTIFVISLLTT